MSNRWDYHWLRVARQYARMSKDPSTQVGAVVVRDREQISAGFNGLPRNIADTVARLANRDLKYSMIVHAELNALLTAARAGISVKGCTLYLVCTDGQETWSGPPCASCCAAIIQAGIDEVVHLPPKLGWWAASVQLGQDLLYEAGVGTRQVEVLP